VIFSSFFIHVSALLDQVRHQLDHALLSRIKERMLGPVLAQRCLDLVVPNDEVGVVESGFAELKQPGVSAGAWRGRACMCGPSGVIHNVWCEIYGVIHNVWCEQHVYGVMRHSCGVINNIQFHHT
jgi:hypothetical protein